MFQNLLYVTLAAFLIFTPLTHAQQAGASAPVPSQIVSAKSIFISNAPWDPYCHLYYKGNQSVGYNSFYAAFQQWNHYQVVTAPSAADLVFDWSCKSLVMNGDARTGYDPYILLRIRDPKTNVVLWSVKENIHLAVGAKSRDKKFDQALAAIVDQLKQLTGAQNK